MVTPPQNQQPQDPPETKSVMGNHMGSDDVTSDNNHSDRKSNSTLAIETDSFADNSATATTGHSRSNSTPTHSSTMNLRQAFGMGANTLSDMINTNIVAARYAVFASIGLLTAYGISQTPLVSRYRTVADIPSRHFRTRRTITGRLMICHNPSNNNSNNNNHNPVALSKNPSTVTFYMRHLSPIERLLPKSWLQNILSMHPAVTLRGVRPEESPHELLHVQVAGLLYPSLPESKTTIAKGLRQQISLTNEKVSSSQYNNNNNNNSLQEQQQAEREWLEILAHNRVIVQCQLLGREVPQPLQHPVDGNTRNKRPIPGLEPITHNTGASSSSMMSATTAVHSNQSQSDIHQVAVAYVRYFPSRYPLFGVDLGEYMIQTGRAIPSQDGLYTHTPKERITDTTHQIEWLRRDAAYIQRLIRAEYMACDQSYGIWMDPMYRECRSDVVEEVNFQHKASMLQKIWRWLRRRC